MFLLVGCNNRKESLIFLLLWGIGMNHSMLTASTVEVHRTNSPVSSQDHVIAGSAEFSDFAEIYLVDPKPFRSFEQFEAILKKRLRDGFPTEKVRETEELIAPDRVSGSDLDRSLELRHQAAKFLELNMRRRKQVYEALSQGFTRLKTTTTISDLATDEFQKLDQSIGGLDNLAPPTKAVIPKLEAPDYGKVTPLKDAKASLRLRRLERNCQYLAQAIREQDVLGYRQIINSLLSDSNKYSEGRQPSCLMESHSSRYLLKDEPLNRLIGALAINENGSFAPLAIEDTLSLNEIILLARKEGFDLKSAAVLKLFFLIVTKPTIDLSTEEIVFLNRNEIINLLEIHTLDSRESILKDLDKMIEAFKA